MPHNRRRSRITCFLMYNVESLKMKKTLVPTILALLACLITCSSVRTKPGLSASQDKADEAAVNRYLRALEGNANDHAATDGLKRLIDRPNPLPNSPSYPSLPESGRGISAA